SKNIQTASGVELSESQRTIVGSVLDLFAGRPSLAKLQLWKDDAEFTDPLTIAKGRAQYEAQWYGLQTAFSEIERLGHEVKSNGNPIEMDLETRYVVKGLGTEKKISSKIQIWTDGDKIVKVADKSLSHTLTGVLREWIAARGINRTGEQLLRPRQPIAVAPAHRAWVFYLWNFTWETTLWRAFRRLNAVTVPNLVSVPKNAEEDAKRGNQ
ncbi:hypothetical protein LTR53_014311, partial [Teratosphaeriaceae sp. CCFEE 6253]